MNGDIRNRRTEVQGYLDNAKGLSPRHRVIAKHFHYYWVQLPSVSPSCNFLSCDTLLIDSVTL